MSPPNYSAPGAKAVQEAVTEIMDAMVRFAEAIQEHVLPREGNLSESDTPPLRLPEEPRCTHNWLPAGHEAQICSICERCRHPCSPTCTHDDAATPGHPERVKERSEALQEASRLLTRNDAMRAACLEAALEWAQKNGISPAQQQALKAEIEGAAL